MTQNSCSGCSPCDSSEKEFESIKIEKTKNVCSLCENFAHGHLEKKTPVAVLSCDGACLKGEISRRVANLICFDLLPEKTARICLGGAFTKDTGQRSLVSNTPRVIALEGCLINCSSRMMKAVIGDLNPEIVRVDKFYQVDSKLFAINDLPEEKIKELAKTAADKIVELI